MGQGITTLYPPYPMFPVSDVKEWVWTGRCWRSRRRRRSMFCHPTEGLWLSSTAPYNTYHQHYLLRLDTPQGLFDIIAPTLEELTVKYTTFLLTGDEGRKIL